MTSAMPVNRIWTLAVFVTVAGCGTTRRPAVAPSGAPTIVADARLVAYQGSDSEYRNTALAYGRFGIVVVIHGRALRMIADHGANSSTLTDAAIDRLHLHHWYDGASRIDTLVRRVGTALLVDSTAEMTTTRGDTTFEYWDIPEPEPIDSIRIGTSRQDSVWFPLELPAASLAPFDGLMGREFLSQFDLLFDMPAGTLRLLERSPTAVAGRQPDWLPNGLTHRDCVSAPVRHHMMDTTGIDDDGRRQLTHNPAKRLFEQKEMQLPISVEGRPVNGTFDSGAAYTSMNWAAARAIGLTRASPRVHPYMAGGSRLVTINARPTRSSGDPASAGSGDSTFAVTGLTLQVGRSRLSADTVFIADPDFADSPGFATEPMIIVGLRQVRDLKVFLSYSSGFVCLGRGRA